MYHHLLRRTAAPAAACLFSASVMNNTETSKFAWNKALVSCEAQSPKTDVRQRDEVPKPNEDEKEEEVMYKNLFPLRQLWKPKVEYPLWDDDWDGKKMKSKGDKVDDSQRKRFIRKNGVTRHIILVRHGQYDETHQEDSKRLLTPLGREQADLTGKRLAEIIKGIDEKFGPCNVKTLRVSDMARAKETADIIGKHLPDSVIRTDPDPNLNEGRPCHYLPGGKASSNTIAKTDEGHPRIEAAFESYFYRANEPEDEVDSGDNDRQGNRDENSQDELEMDPHHEFEIIVCHANVIRYFFCRALQIPPEAWLRLCTFNCSLTYLTIRPTGSVSCRMLGDIGHLGYDHTTFSMHHGFNW